MASTYIGSTQAATTYFNFHYAKGQKFNLAFVVCQYGFIQSTNAILCVSLGNIIGGLKEKIKNI